MGFKITRYDDSLFTSAEKKDEYLDNKENYSTIVWKNDPDGWWAAPFVTGHKYKIHWGQTGIDWEKLKVVISERWEEADNAVWLVSNHTDIRAKITSYDKTANIKYENDTIKGTDLSSTNTFASG